MAPRDYISGQLATNPVDAIACIARNGPGREARGHRGRCVHDPPADRRQVGPYAHGTRDPHEGREGGENHRVPPSAEENEGSRVETAHNPSCVL